MTASARRRRVTEAETDESVPDGAGRARAHRDVLEHARRRVPQADRPEPAVVGEAENRVGRGTHQSFEGFRRVQKLQRTGGVPAHFRHWIIQ